MTASTIPPLSIWPCGTPYGNTQKGPDSLRSAPITDPLSRSFGISNRSPDPQRAGRGEPLNEKADTQAENARQLSPECQQWTTRTKRMTYEWEDSNGVQHVTAWSKAVRNAMLSGGAEYQVQRVLDRAGTNWNKNFLISTYVGLKH